MSFPPVSIALALAPLHGDNLGWLCPTPSLRLLALFLGGGKRMRQAQGEMAQGILRQVVGTASGMAEGTHARMRGDAPDCWHTSRHLIGQGTTFAW